MDPNQPFDVSSQASGPAQTSAAPQAQPGASFQQPPAVVSSDSGQVTLSDEQNESLDQEWVNKAKDIVERTQGDPFTQANELSKVKAGYLKARYNKDIKNGEDSA